MAGGTEYDARQCGDGSVLDAERFVGTLLYAQVALGAWTVCTGMAVWRAAARDERVGGSRLLLL
jgi:hypothetical protein